MSSDLSISNQQPVPLSESDIRVNYNNVSQVIAASNGGAVSGINGQQWQFYSSDGGATWSQTHLPLVMGDTTHTDPCVDWTSDGTAWAITIGTNGPNSLIRAYQSPDGGKTWNFDGTPSGAQTGTDKEMMWVDHSPTSPHKDNIYVIWQNPAFVGRRSGGVWQAPVQVSGAETTGSPVGADIRTNSAGEVFAFWPDTGSQNLFMAKSTNGGANFAAPVSMAKTFGSYELRIPADSDRKVLIYISAGVYKDATRDLVHAVWTDLSGEAGCTAGAGPGTDVTASCKSRIWYTRSKDGGGTWDPPKMLKNQAGKNDQFFPRLVVDETNGQLAVVYYDTVNDAGRHKTDVWLQTSQDDGATWSSATLLTSGETDETVAGADNSTSPFLQDQYGDYIGFTGYAGKYFPCWTDRRGGQHEEIWSIPVRAPNCFLIVDKSTFGQDEVEVQLPGTALFKTAFWVGVEGFTAAQLGFNAPADLSNPNPNPLPAVSYAVDPALNPGLTAAQITAINNMLGMQYGPPPVTPEDPTLTPTFQRYLYPFTISFNGDGGFTALAANQVAIVTINASININGVTRSASANIELTRGEDPYFTDVNPMNPNQPSWLSFDLRFFKVNGGQARFGAPAMSNNAADAPGFIANVLTQLNTPGSNLMGDSFEGLTQDEDLSALEFLQKDNANNYVFNFALARVRLIGKTPGAQAKAVRVFFRLFQAQTVGSEFNDQTSYRFFSDGVNYGQKIALAGIENNEYVTVPCFATARVDTTAVSMTTQTDPPNVQTITVNPGVEVDTYFGCWIDANQPQQKVMPQTPPGGDPDGPWGGGTTLYSLNEVITKSPHQCMIAEIRFDDTPVPAGANSATSDKLAQRNIAWIDGPNPGTDPSRRMPHPIELKPTLAGVSTPDEVMILWGDTPGGSTASLYLPSVPVAEILKLANRLYAAHQLTQEDANTLSCPVGGVTFIPLPPGKGRTAGLLTVNLSAGVRRGQIFNVAVRQITEAVSRVIQPGGIAGGGGLQVRASHVGPHRVYDWRRFLGGFEFTLTIRTKAELLYGEERLLAWLLWIFKSMPATNRWYPVWQQYISQIGGRVLGFGGNPGQIQPSPTGTVPQPGGGRPGRGRGPEARHGYTGKISGLIFDRYGDFDGFVLDTAEREHKFFSREKDMEELAARVWRERLLITVWAERDEPHRPMSILVHQPPASFHN
jgi:hypothetical protein